MNALAQSSQQWQANPNSYTLLYFGNDSYIQCIDFKEAVDTSSYLKPLLELYHIKTIDPEDCPNEYIPYLALTDSYPFFLVIDTNGASISALKGFSEESEIREFLDAADTMMIKHSYQDIVVLSKKRSRIAKTADRYTNMLAHGRSYDFTVGYLNSWFSSSAPFRSGSYNGYSISTVFRQRIAPGLFMFTGISLEHSGGFFVGKDIVENNLRLPIGLELFLARFPWNYFSDVRMRFGIWGSENVKNIDCSGYQKWNAGGSTEIVIESGSFDIHFGYSKGFISRFTNTDKTIVSNMLTIGVRLRWGD